MESVLIVGLGEVGSALYTIFKESGNFKVFGLDIDKTKWQPLNPKLPKQVDSLHICFPYTEDFQSHVIALVNIFKPKLTIIESTIAPKTTENLATYLKKVVIHSPVRGMHCEGQMVNDIKRWIKYIGCIQEVYPEAEKHYAKANIKTVYLGSSTESELAKLANTTYRAWMITYFQELHRITKRLECELPNVMKLIIDDHKIEHTKPPFYPDCIGGHCLIPNTEILSKHSSLFSLILKSNQIRQEEIKDESVKAEIEQVKEMIKR